MVASVTVEIFLIARLADNLLVPKVMSESVGVSPIGVMFAVFAGGELFGIPGLLLGIPAAALIKVLFKYFVQPYVLRMQFAEGPHLDLLVETPAGVEVEVDVEQPAAAGAEIPPPVAVSVRT
jgi:predicted PurR-regulated permease PerM